MLLSKQELLFCCRSGRNRFLGNRMWKFGARSLLQRVGRRLLHRLGNKVGFQISSLVFLLSYFRDELDYFALINLNRVFFGVYVYSIGVHCTDGDSVLLGYVVRLGC